MKIKKIVDETTNRGEFNRAYKDYLERKGKIRCAYCKYHRNENNTDRYYGGTMQLVKGRIDITYPNWKLVSKNRKQWMKNSSKIIKNESYMRRFNDTVYYDIIFK